MFALVALNSSLLWSHCQHVINMSSAMLRHFISFPFSPHSLINPLPYIHSSPSLLLFLSHSLPLSPSSLWVHLVVQHLNTMKQRVVEPWCALVLCLLCSPPTLAINDFFTSIGGSHAFSSFLLICCIICPCFIFMSIFTVMDIRIFKPKWWCFRGMFVLGLGN